MLFCVSRTARICFLHFDLNENSISLWRGWHRRAYTVCVQRIFSKMALRWLRGDKLLKSKKMSLHQFFFQCIRLLEFQSNNYRTFPAYWNNTKINLQRIWIYYWWTLKQPQLGPSQKKGIKRLTDALLNRPSTWSEELMSVKQDANMSCCAGISGLLMPSHWEPDTLNSAHFKM